MHEENKNGTMTWEQYYELAKKYYEYHGDLFIPFYFKTKNGYEKDDIGITLGKWMSRQRIKYFKLSRKKQELLEEIGFVLEVREEKWQNMYSLAQKYYEYYGNLKVPKNFKTINGYLYDNKGAELGKWIAMQRQYFKKYTKIRQELLLEIGFILKPLEDDWLNNYNLAKKYFEYHGNLRISHDFKTKNGYLYDDEGFYLGYWVYSQRKNYGKLSKEKRDLLNSIGFSLNVHEERWLNNYNLAKEYYEHHGNLNVPSGFKTINGYLYNNKGFGLGNWLYYQRKNYMNLSARQRELLKDIGFVNENEWLNNYNLAKIYYAHYGNLLMPSDFKTCDGFRYDESGFNLSVWLDTQKNFYDELTEEQKTLLEDIGFKGKEDTLKLTRKL